MKEEKESKKGTRRNVWKKEEQQNTLQKVMKILQNVITERVLSRFKIQTAQSLIYIRLECKKKLEEGCKLRRTFEINLYKIGMQEKIGRGCELRRTFEINFVVNCFFVFCFFFEHILFVLILQV